MPWIGVILANVALSGCAWANLCENDSFWVYPSPSQALKVVVFRRSCGATTGFSTQASLLASNEALPSGPGDILSIDDPSGKIAKNGAIDVHVDFDSESVVTLSYLAQARVFLRAESKKGVQIRHQRLDKPWQPPPVEPYSVTDKSFGPECKADSDCRDGRECARWGSFAGENPRSTCELPCENKRSVRRCPEGMSCHEFADDGPYTSPGGVCLRTR